MISNRELMNNQLRRKCSSWTRLFYWIINSVHRDIHSVDKHVQTPSEEPRLVSPLCNSNCDHSHAEKCFYFLFFIFFVVTITPHQRATHNLFIERFNNNKRNNKSEGLEEEQKRVRERELGSGSWAAGAALIDPSSVHLFLQRIGKAVVVANGQQFEDLLDGFAQCDLRVIVPSLQCNQCHFPIQYLVLQHLLISRAIFFLLNFFFKTVRF